MKFLSQLLAAMLLLIFIACNREGSKEQILNKDITLLKTQSYKQEEQFKSAIGVLDTLSPVQSEKPLEKSSQGNAQTKVDWDKKIIKTGNLTLEVKNYKTFNDFLHNGVKQFGGYVAQEEQNQSEYKIENVITIKVPVDQFDNAVGQLVSSNEKIIVKKIESTDVTGEIQDTKSRMEAKKRIRDRYLDLLKQAKNMEEILQVQNEINDMQENIEAAAGRIDYLGHAAIFSTINITFYQVLNPNIINEPAPSYLTRLFESFKTGLNWFAEAFIAIVSLWPLWLGVGILWFFLKRKIILSKNQKSTAS